MDNDTYVRRLRKPRSSADGQKVETRHIVSRWNSTIVGPHGTSISNRTSVVDTELHWNTDGRCHYLI